MNTLLDLQKRLCAIFQVRYQTWGLYGIPSRNFIKIDSRHLGRTIGTCLSVILPANVFQNDRVEAMVLSGIFVNEINLEIFHLTLFYQRAVRYNRNPLQSSHSGVNQTRLSLTSPDLVCLGYFRMSVAVSSCHLQRTSSIHV